MTFGITKMKFYIYIIILCLTLFGCGDRYFTEHELYENSFDEKTMTYIEETVKFDIPYGAKGLNFYYKPPVDPRFIAKIAIPAEAEQYMKTQIATLQNSDNFPNEFGDFDSNWWPSNTDNAIISRKVSMDGYYIEAHLIKDKRKQLMLFLKYFTI